VRDDADRAGMSSRGGHETEDSVDEGPVAIEKGTARVDEVLQHCPYVREGSGVSNERRLHLIPEVVQLVPSITARVHHKCSEALDAAVPLLDLAVRQLAIAHWARPAVRHAQLCVAATAIAADGKQRGLCTHSRHEANGVSEIRAVRKRACLCGVCRCELLLTVDDCLLGRDVESRNGANLLADGSWKMNQVSGRGERRGVNRFQRNTDFLQHTLDSLLCFVASLPLLCRLQRVVRPLRSSGRGRSFR
jgi:hypothetical protein